MHENMHIQYSMTMHIKEICILCRWCDYAYLQNMHTGDRTDYAYFTYWISL